MQIVYLKNLRKLQERTYTVSISSQNVSACWFANSEKILLAYNDKFEIINALQPETPELTVDCKLSNDKRIPPKVVFYDRMLILRRRSNKLVFYDLQRQKFVAQCEINNV